jgi:polyhydroxyalkanoate synthesis regulator protein
MSSSSDDEGFYHDNAPNSDGGHEESSVCEDSPTGRQRIIEDSLGGGGGDQFLSGAAAAELRRRLGASLRENKNLKTKILAIENFHRRAQIMQENPNKAGNPQESEMALMSRKLLNERQLLRQEVGNFKQEISRLKTILAKSIGPDRLDELIAMPIEVIEGEFRGQAEIIEELRRKIKQNRNSGAPALSPSANNPNLASVGVSPQEVETLLKQKDEEAENLRRNFQEKLKMAKARIAALEKDVMDQKEKIKILTDKSKNDDILIADLRKFVEFSHHSQSQQAPRPLRTLRVGKCELNITGSP